MARAAVKKKSAPLASRPRAREAYNQIIRLIRARRLQPGMKLPTQAELCRELEVSNDSINAAMELLVTEGVLERRPKAGTILVDADAARVEQLWTVGVLSRHTTLANGFMTPLFHAACRELQKQGASPRFFYASADVFFPTVDDYPGLAEALADKQLAGLLGTSFYAEPPPLPIVTAVECPGASLVGLDWHNFCIEAMRWAHELGHTRVGWLYSTNYIYDMCLNDALCRVRAAGIELADPIRLATFTRTDYFVAGQQLFQTLNTYSRDQWPTAWIICDDVLGAGFLDVLSRETNYRPDCITETNREIETRFALPVRRLEFSLDELGVCMADTLMETIRHPGARRYFEMIRPHRTAAPPAQ